MIRGKKRTFGKLLSIWWKDDRPLSYRALLSALAGFSISFIFIYGAFDIYNNNREEFAFSIGGISIYLICIGLGMFVVLAGFLLLLKGKFFDIAYSLEFATAFLFYIQGNFLNIGITSLFGDDLEDITSSWGSIINLLIWIVVFVLCVLLAVLIKNKSKLFTVFNIVLIAIVVMLSASLIALSLQIGGEVVDSSTTEMTNLTTAPTSTDTGQPSESTDPETIPETTKPLTPLDNYVLTVKNQFELSSGKNVIVFIPDRFDVDYYDELEEFQADFFSPLDGFTYYADNIAMYSRTYPAITQMVTGIENPFDTKAEEYFYNAYQNSVFLKDLKADNFKINLYITNYYTFRDASVLAGVADNVLSFTDYKIKDPVTLSLKMLVLSAYRYSPNIMKTTFRISSGSFTDVIDFDSNYPAYSKNDAQLYDNFKKSGITVQDEKNTFTFFLMSGFHPPYKMTAEGEYKENTSRLEAGRGCFKFIYEYLDELKRLGLYKDATIIITGDHCAAYSDYSYITGTRLTSMLIKNSGDEGTPLKVSDAPVSHDNLQATIIKSAGIEASVDYGPAHDEIPTDADIVRRYLFQLNSSPAGVDDLIVEYHITGSGRIFENWEIFKEHKIGYVYK